MFPYHKICHYFDRWDHLSDAAIKMKWYKGIKYPPNKIPSWNGRWGFHVQCTWLPLWVSFINFYNQKKKKKIILDYYYKCKLLYRYLCSSSKLQREDCLTFCHTPEWFEIEIENIWSLYGSFVSRGPQKNTLVLISWLYSIIVVTSCFYFYFILVC